MGWEPMVYMISQGSEFSNKISYGSIIQATAKREPNDVTYKMFDRNKVFWQRSVLFATPVLMIPKTCTSHKYWNKINTYHRIMKSASLSEVKIYTV